MEQQHSDATGDDPKPPTLPTLQNYDLPVERRECTREVAVPNVVEQLIGVPHVEYIERIEEVPNVRQVSKVVPVPLVEVTERIIEIPKPVNQENVVTVPHIQIVDKIVEVPQYITKRKVVEVPKILFQERIIPIPKHTVEEKIVEVPDQDFEKIMKEKVQYVSPKFDFVMADNAAADNLGYTRDQKGKGKPVDEIIYIPHIQLHILVDRSEVFTPMEKHLYRNIVEPVFRHIPEPIEVPLTHYSPVPVEHLIDRNVPIAVELEVTQEFLCPRLIPKQVEIPTPVNVTRFIEKPVPIDAMFNSVIMDAYLTDEQAQKESQRCSAMCSEKPQIVTARKLPGDELRKMGIRSSPSLSDVLSFKSRGLSAPCINMEKKRMYHFQK